MCSLGSEEKSNSKKVNFIEGGRLFTIFVCCINPSIHFNFVIIMKTNLKILVAFILFCFATPITMLAQGSGDCTYAPTHLSWTSAPCVTKTITFGAPYNTSCDAVICFCYNNSGGAFNIYISSIKWSDEDCIDGIPNNVLFAAVRNAIYKDLINVAYLPPCSEDYYAVGDAYFTACFQKVRVPVVMGFPPYQYIIYQTWILPCGTGHCVHSYKFCYSNGQLIIIPNGTFTIGAEECTGGCLPYCQ